MRKILLNKSVSKTSVNKTNTIPVELNRDVSVFYDEVLTETINTMQVYNDEKDKSTKHRFIFTLKPYMTNILHNKITEVVLNNGGEIKIIGNDNIERGNGYVSSSDINRIQCIRNTEYSNYIKNGPKYDYHIGVDIFNNHLLRSKDDVAILPTKEYTTNLSSVVDKDNKEIKGNFTDFFNTIGDRVRDNDGNSVKTILPNSNDFLYKNTTAYKFPSLYIFDTIKTFKDAYKDGIKIQNGWVGVNNVSTLKIPIKNNYYVNKLLNNKEACQFIDMSPERDLFFFTPKKNESKSRIEHNWYFRLTYPYKSIYEDNVNILKGKGYGLPLSPFSVGSNNSVMYKEFNNNIPYLMFRTPVKHNLQVGNIIKLIFDDESSIKCKVTKIGNEQGKLENYYFSVYKSELENIIDIVDNNNPKSFIKIHGGFECEYYYRKFKPLNRNEKYSINKLAFSNTIYGDEISQLIYLDDFDVKDIIDNRGRPITDVYLTVVKANDGWKEWYEENKPNEDSVRYSHVFGKITSGLDIPSYAGTNVPSVRFQHNIGEIKNSSIKIDNSSLMLDNDVKIEDEDFFGDLVEFNPMTLEETVLEDILYRFNTAQREITNNPIYNTIYHDEIAGDIYDGKDKTVIVFNKLNEGFANLAPEGYIYKPHYKIQLRKFEENINQGYDDVINSVDNILFENEIEDEMEYGLKFVTLGNYALLPNDLISIMDKKTYKLYKYIVESYSYDGEKKGWLCVSKLLNIDEKPILEENEFLKQFILFKHNISIPNYAYMLPDGSGMHLWKEIQKPSTYTFMDELYEIPFTNGAHYHHKNINFFLKRQDPFKEYKMFIKDENGLQIDNNFELNSIEYDNSKDEYVREYNTSCF